MKSSGFEPESSAQRNPSLLFPTTSLRTSDGALLTCWPTSRKAQLENGKSRNSTARPLSRGHPYSFPTTSPRTSDGGLLVCWTTPSKTKLEGRIPNTDAEVGRAPCRRREAGASMARYAVVGESRRSGTKKSIPTFALQPLRDQSQGMQSSRGTRRSKSVEPEGRAQRNPSLLLPYFCLASR